jgi:hypothetical protein
MTQSETQSAQVSEGSKSARHSHWATLHVATGIGSIVASLFTDYRAYRGVGNRHGLVSSA